jgi:hypothetical protein
VRKSATVLRRPAVRSRPAPPASPWLAHLRRRRAQTDWSMCFALSVPLARSSFFSRGRTDQGRLKVLPKGEALLTEIRRFESRSLRQRLSFSQFRGCRPQRPRSPARCTAPRLVFDPEFRLPRVPARLRATSHTACRRAPRYVRHGYGAVPPCLRGSGDRLGTPCKVPVGSCR